MSGPIHSFICEKCHDPVLLTWPEYIARQKTHKNYSGTSGGKYGLKILCDGCTVAAHREKRAKKAKPVRRQREFMPRDSLNLRPNERNEYGVTVTIRDQETLKMLTISAKGPVITALTTVCDMIDSRDGCWRIVSVSTPASIFSDLQGAKSEPRGTMEATMLGKVKRRDLLEVRR